MCQFIDLDPDVSRKQNVATRATESFSPDDKDPKIRGTVENYQKIAQIDEERRHWTAHKGSISHDLKTGGGLGRGRRTYVFEDIDDRWENVGDQEFGYHQDKHYIRFVLFSETIELSSFLTVSIPARCTFFVPRVNLRIWSTERLPKDYCIFPLNE